MSTDTAPAMAGAATDGPELLQVEDVVQNFVVQTPGQGRRVVQAVSGVSFDMTRGETLTLVGESGCGKSSLARVVIQSPRPQSGVVRFLGNDLTQLRGKELRESLLGMQLIFQDPYSSLDPHWRVGDLVAEPLKINSDDDKRTRSRRSDELLELVGLNPAVYRGRHPRELSGGQCQRVAIARAIALSPQLLICDEPVSSLDVSIQAQILNLFETLRVELGLSYLFITHDLAVAKHVSDRVAVMYLGKVVEISDAASLFSGPLHPYASALLSAIPDPDAEPGTVERTPLKGDLPSAANPPSGCRFRTRCPYVRDICAEVEPPLVAFSPTHSVACHFPLTTGPRPVPEVVEAASGSSV